MSYQFREKLNNRETKYLQSLFRMAKYMPKWLRKQVIRFISSSSDFFSETKSVDHSMDLYQLQRFSYISPKESEVQFQSLGWSKKKRKLPQKRHKGGEHLNLVNVRLKTVWLEST